MSCDIRYRETADTYKCEIIKIIKKSLLLEDIKFRNYKIHSKCNFM